MAKKVKKPKKLKLRVKKHKTKMKLEAHWKQAGDKLERSWEDR